MNPVSAMASATIDRLSSDPLVRAFRSSASQAASEIDQRIGCRIEQSAEDRHQVTAKLGAVKTSMLLDSEAGRALEFDAIVPAVHEFRRRIDVAIPNIDALLGLARLVARVRGIDPDGS